MTAAVVLLDAGARAVHDGAALAGYLEGCEVRRYRSEPTLDAGIVAEDLCAGGLDLLFFAVDAANLEGALRVARRLPPEVTRLLFGRLFDDPRRRGAATEVDGLIVGEPFHTARAVQRSAAGGRALPRRLPGLLRAGGLLVPREPLRDLDALPPADYGALSREVALQLPMRVSRSYPHPCLLSAERVWELPVRRRSVARVLEEIGLHVERYGARRLCFTDQCLNTDTGWLLELCGGLVARGPCVRWHGRVWPDPLLDGAAIRLLRRSGCRSLDIDLFSGSARLCRELATGVHPDRAGELVRRCRSEGILARVSLVVGAPGEQDVDRTATMAWLEEQGGWLHALSDVGPCRLEEGAPIRRVVHLPADGDPAEWHDGGENNASRRATWHRELVELVDNLELPRPRTGGGFPDRLAPRVRRRLADRIQAHQAADPRWRRAHLLEAGLLHGREAFCGPVTLELDPGLDPAAALALIEEAAALGTRRLVLGGEGALATRALEDQLERAAALDLTTTLRGGLVDLESADLLRRVGDRTDGIELEVDPVGDGAGWEAAMRWLPVLAAQRAEQQISRPRLALRVRLGRGCPAPGEILEGTLEAGADHVWVDLERGEERRMTAAERDATREALRALLGRALLDPPWEEGAWPASEPDVPFVPGAGWPPGFRLEPTRAVCPAGVEALGLRRRAADPGVRSAAFDGRRCVCCDLLADCPVDRVDFHVRLGLSLLREPGRLLLDLEQPDSGLGRRGRWVESHPCFVGWDAARVDRDGGLRACPECGSEPVGNVLEQGLARLWYSGALNDLRHMARTGAKAIPFISRARCGEVCRRVTRNTMLQQRLEALGPVRRQALDRLGASDRRSGSALGR